MTMHDMPIQALVTATVDRFSELHDSMKHVIAALPAAALDWTPTPEVNSVAVLITHVCGSERFWIGEKVGRLPAHRDRAAEFTVHSIAASDLVDALDATLDLIAAVMGEMPPERLAESAGVTHDGIAYDGAWALQHALEHVAVHTGHVELMLRWWENQA